MNPEPSTETRLRKAVREEAASLREGADARRADPSSAAVLLIVAERLEAALASPDPSTECPNPYCDGEGNIYGEGPHPLGKRLVGQCQESFHTPSPEPEEPCGDCGGSGNDQWYDHTSETLVIEGPCPNCTPQPEQGEERRHQAIYDELKAVETELKGDWPTTMLCDDGKHDECPGSGLVRGTLRPPHEPDAEGHSVWVTVNCRCSCHDAVAASLTEKENE